MSANNAVFADMQNFFFVVENLCKNKAFPKSIRAGSLSLSVSNYALFSMKGGGHERVGGEVAVSSLGNKRRSIKGQTGQVWRLSHKLLQEITFQVEGEFLI